MQNYWRSFHTTPEGNRGPWANFAYYVDFPCGIRDVHVYDSVGRGVGPTSRLLGQELANGGQINIAMGNCNKNGELTASSFDAWRKMFVLMYYDVVIEIRDSQILVLE